MTDAIEVTDSGTPMAFDFEEMLRYSGPGSPAGVALAFKAMELAFAWLAPDGPPERRQVVVDTAFRGPGARDGFELVTRCATEGRYIVDAGLERPDRGVNLEQFVFRPGYRDQSVTLVVSEGWITDEFIYLARNPQRSFDEDNRFTEVKRLTAERLMASAPENVFDVEAG